MNFEDALLTVIGAALILLMVADVFHTLLYPHGSGPVAVSIDDGPVTDLSILETLRVSAIESVRLERASSPVGPPRITPTGGVIFGDMLEVKTRHGPVQPEATRAECSDVRHGA